MDKELIQKRFTKSIKTYDSEAIAQKLIAEEIISGMKLLGISNLDSVLEIGSGTGLLTKMLLDNFYIKNIKIIDLISETNNLQIQLSEQYPETKITALIGDVEQIIIKEQFDLIVSSSTLHWLSDFSSFSKKIYSWLNASGFFIFNTFGPENMKEIRSVSKIGLNYNSCETVLSLLLQSFQVEKNYSQEICLKFSSPEDILRHLKKTGVNGLQKQTWTKSKYKAFIANYYQYCNCCNHVQLTYHPMFYYCRKNK